MVSWLILAGSRAGLVPKQTVGDTECRCVLISKSRHGVMADLGWLRAWLGPQTICWPSHPWLDQRGTGQSMAELSICLLPLEKQKDF